MEKRKSAIESMRSNIKNLKNYAKQSVSCEKCRQFNMNLDVTRWKFGRVEGKKHAHTETKWFFNTAIIDVSLSINFNLIALYSINAKMSQHAKAVILLE